MYVKYCCLCWDGSEVCCFPFLIYLLYLYHFSFKLKCVWRKLVGYFVRVNEKSGVLIADKFLAMLTFRSFLCLFKQRSQGNYGNDIWRSVKANNAFTLTYVSGMIHNEDLTHLEVNFFYKYDIQHLDNVFFTKTANLHEQTWQNLLWLSHWLLSWWNLPGHVSKWSYCENGTMKLTQDLVLVWAYCYSSSKFFPL